MLIKSFSFAFPELYASSGDVCDELDTLNGVLKLEFFLTNNLLLSFESVLNENKRISLGVVSKNDMPFRLTSGESIQFFINGDRLTMQSLFFIFSLFSVSILEVPSKTPLSGVSFNLLALVFKSRSTTLINLSFKSSVGLLCLMLLHKPDADCDWGFNTRTGLPALSEESFDKLLVICDCFIPKVIPTKS